MTLVTVTSTNTQYFLLPLSWQAQVNKMLLAEKSQEEQFETLHTTAKSIFHNNTDTWSLRGVHAATAHLECLSESIFHTRCQLPKIKLEALDWIQNKELFIIIYTKLVHLKKNSKIQQLCWPPEEAKSSHGSLNGAHNDQSPSSQPQEQGTQLQGRSCGSIIGSASWLPFTRPGKQARVSWPNVNEHCLLWPKLEPKLDQYKSWVVLFLWHFQ